MFDDRNWNLIKDTLKILPTDIENIILSYYDVSEHSHPEEIYMENHSHIKTYKEYKGRYFTGFSTVLYILYVKYNDFHLAIWEKDDFDYIKTSDKLLEDYVKDSDESINSDLAGYLC